MKPIFVVAVLSIITSVTHAQDAGIQFEKGLTWEQVKQEALQEHKWIFVDCYATWCGPCKLMDENVFPQQEVGEYFNAHFINVKIQMDSMAKDDDAVRSWYKSAVQFEKEYKISSYPTYLFFNEKGEAMHHITGATKARDFLVRAKDAFIPEKQYYTVLGHWKEHTGDSVFLLKALKMAVNIRDIPESKALSEAYLNIIKNPFSTDQLDMLARTINSSKDKAFTLFVNNPVIVDTLLKRSFFAAQFDKTIMPVLYKEEVGAQLAKANWKEIEGNVQQKYPLLGTWKAANKDSAFVFSMFFAARSAKDKDNSRLLGEAYLQQVSNHLTQQCISMITQFAKEDSVADGKYFSFLLNNAGKIDAVMKKEGYTEEYLAETILRNDIKAKSAQKQTINIEAELNDIIAKYSSINSDLLRTSLYKSIESIINKDMQDMAKKEGMKEGDWRKLLKVIKKKYQVYDCDTTFLYGKFIYYGVKQSWDTSASFVLAYIKKYPGKVSDGQINAFCWGVAFQRSRTKAVLEEAIRIMKPVVDRNMDNEEWIDTYANLLYKAGHKEEGIEWETKAHNIDSSASDITENLEKMKKGKHTWD